MSKALTKRMADAHEEFLVGLFGGRCTPGSGNQFNRQMDGRQNHLDQPIAFAWDGKSTMGQSIGVSRPMWSKAIEQAHGERPMLPLRFYDTERLDVGLDLAVVNIHDLAELLDQIDTLRGEHYTALWP
jgi:hypothetical protein